MTTSRLFSTRDGLWVRVSRWIVRYGMFTREQKDQISRLVAGALDTMPGLVEYYSVPLNLTTILIVTIFDTERGARMGPVELLTQMQAVLGSTLVGLEEPMVGPIIQGYRRDPEG